MSLRIIHWPHPTLLRTSKPLRRVDDDLRTMIRQMFDLMYEHKGVGLAANQVDLPYRVFVVNESGDPALRDQERVFLNPVLSKHKGSAEDEEGCLSLPGLYAPVVRPERVWINAYDLRGEEADYEASGRFARILQHETDHLDGTMFIDRLSPMIRAEMMPELESFLIEFEQRRAQGEIPSDAAITQRLEQLERART